jgi:hypothetical protein
LNWETNEHGGGGQSIGVAVEMAKAMATGVPIGDLLQDDENKITYILHSKSTITLANSIKEATTRDRIREEFSSTRWYTN